MHTDDCRIHTIIDGSVSSAFETEARFYGVVFLEPPRADTQGSCIPDDCMSSDAPPRTDVFDLQMKKLPALVSGNFTCELVAGARYESVQIEMKPLNRYLAGLRRVA
jgi:hypothetical protein